MLPYVVQPGDTLLRIAKRFEVNIASLLAANPRLSPAAQLAPGLLLFIPSQTVTFYCVQPGDRILKLADQFSLSLPTLLAANPHIDPKQLVTGQLITIPHTEYPSIVDPRAEYGPEDLRRDAAIMEQTYPFLEVRPFGTSVMGKSLLALRIGEGRAKVHVNAAMHANEWITAPLLMRFIEELSDAGAQGGQILQYDVRYLLERVTLWFVPMVNPDGVELVQEGIRPNHPYYSELLRWNKGSRRFSKWKANIRGVDLNDQFPAFWEEEVKRRAVEGPGPRDYPGTAPLCEPEARALAELTKSEQFDIAVALHTQGQEIYWNYRGYEPVEAEQLAARLGRASGYKPIKLTGSDAGYKDWFIYEFRKPGFTVELGYGVNPLPLENFEDLYEELKPLLMATILAAIESGTT
ncbi:g-D-glutamyl-meso-diaminopimelate peptidase [Paenibacillus phyllosphaerae]|uniref:G-D-glutamyl-meso-diaminopimelate peptidase n=1 Tax=Paenibacillus phyllosphaerae TaxID=274593 RepID=A0A7W5FM21_9BACL|nr:M14 family metallopeptidase [Paenibacillus phyllosphaerae]MBB3109840.1 g-D-glutamyl-meso-diaminopimelate peptidase [Paenibacillus phyllosphaerae]